MINEYQERHDGDLLITQSNSGLDQFAAAIAAIAKPGMNAAESFDHFLSTVQESECSAEDVLIQKTLAFGLADTEELSHTLEPLITYHLREFYRKDILPRA